MEVFAPSRIVIAKGKIAQQREIVAGDSKTILLYLAGTWEQKH